MTARTRYAISTPMPSRTFLAAAQEIPRKRLLAVVVTISEELEPRLAPDVIVEAVRGHFIKRRQVRRILAAPLSLRYEGMPRSADPQFTMVRPVTLPEATPIH